MPLLTKYSLFEIIERSRLFHVADSLMTVYERCMSTATRIIYPKLYSELAPCPEWPRDWEPGLFHGALHTWTSGASVPPKDII